VVQSRNPSERNKVGEKKKKSQSWLDSLVDAAGDFATGLGRTALSNVAKVGDVGGSMVKGMVVDPIQWAMDNPNEVAKTLTSPERMNTWLIDNFLAGQEIENLVRGQGGVNDAIIAAMSALPIRGLGGVTDDAVRLGAGAAGGLTADSGRLQQQLARSSAKRRAMAELMEDIRIKNEMSVGNDVDWLGNPLPEDSWLYDFFNPTSESQKRLMASNKKFVYGPDSRPKPPDEEFGYRKFHSDPETGELKEFSKAEYLQYSAASKKWIENEAIKEYGIVQIAKKKLRDAANAGDRAAVRQAQIDLAAAEKEARSLFREKMAANKKTNKK
jgi:hypothetical protein